MRVLIDLSPAVAIVETERSRPSHVALTLIQPGNDEYQIEGTRALLTTKQLSDLIDALKRAYVARASAERKITVARDE